MPKEKKASPQKAVAAPARRSGRAKIPRLGPNERAEYDWDPETDCQVFKGILEKSVPAKQKQPATGLKNRSNRKSLEQKDVNEKQITVSCPVKSLVSQTTQPEKPKPSPIKPQATRPATRSQTRGDGGAPVGFYNEHALALTSRKSVQGSRISNGGTSSTATVLGKPVLNVEQNHVLPIETTTVREPVSRGRRRALTVKDVAATFGLPEVPCTSANLSEKDMLPLQPKDLNSASLKMKPQIATAKRPAPYQVQRQFIAQRVDARNRPGTPTPISEVFGRSSATSYTSNDGSVISKKTGLPRNRDPRLLANRAPSPLPVAPPPAPVTTRTARSRGKSSLKSDGGWTEEERISAVTPRPAKKRPRKEGKRKNRKRASPEPAPSVGEVVLRDSPEIHSVPRRSSNGILPSQVGVPRDAGPSHQDVVLHQAADLVEPRVVSADPNPDDDSFVANQADANSLYNEHGLLATAEDRVRYAKLVEVDGLMMGGYMEMDSPGVGKENVNSIGVRTMLFVMQGTIIVHTFNGNRRADGLEMSAGGVVNIGPGRRYIVEATSQQQVKLFYHRQILQ